jgi:cell filamentation protein
MTETTDPYVYPGTDVLRNLRDIRDPEKLARFEGRSTARRILELQNSPTIGEFNALHLIEVHACIFQDIFAWAGQSRTVNISKGSNSFARADFIEPSLNDLFRKLAKESYLRGLNQLAFIERSAFFLGEINAVHPFREGNGRTQREFMRQLASGAGFILNWSGVKRDQMIAASRESFLIGDFRGWRRSSKSAWAK